MLSSDDERAEPACVEERDDDEPTSLPTSTLRGPVGDDADELEVFMMACSFPSRSHRLFDPMVSTNEGDCAAHRRQEGQSRGGRFEREERKMRRMDYY